MNIKYYSYVIGSLFFLFFYSCNQATEKKIDNYIEVRVIDIDESDSKIGLTLIKNNDSIIFGNLSRNNLENYDLIKSKLNINDKLKIKGILNDFNSRKHDYSKKSTIIVINDLVFVE